MSSQSQEFEGCLHNSRWTSRDGSNPTNHKVSVTSGSQAQRNSGSYHVSNLACRMRNTYQPGTCPIDDDGVQCSVHGTYVTVMRLQSQGNVASFHTPVYVILSRSRGQPTIHVAQRFSSLPESDGAESCARLTLLSPPRFALLIMAHHLYSVHVLYHTHTSGDLSPMYSRSQNVTIGLHLTRLNGLRTSSSRLLFHLVMEPRISPAVDVGQMAQGSHSFVPST
jgi:hypothetical protein